ncbi:MAG: S41 family peptidase [Gemmatimonadetes bacterium]|nr:S41 family peptidase [Gemmatimonadota bacterium]
MPWLTHRLLSRVLAGAVLLPCTTYAQTAAATPDSLADVRTAPATIQSLMRTHLFDPRLLASAEATRLASAVDTLAQVVTSRRAFTSGFNRIWSTGPFSHVRLSRAQMPAQAMMAFVDTMRAGADAVSLRWEDRVAILTVRTMNGVDTREAITRRYGEIVAQGAAGLILDLRQNDGGAFAVVPLVGHLLASEIEGGVFLGQRWFRAHDRPPTAEERRAITPWTGWSLTRFWSDVEQAGTLRIRFTPMAPRYAGPVLVLVSGATASAAELATDAMMTNGRVRVLGERTAGQMLSQRMFDLIPGVQLSLPIADYYSARMGRIEGVGITPDVPVPAAVALDSALAMLRRR